MRVPFRLAKKVDMEISYLENVEVSVFKKNQEVQTLALVLKCLYKLYRLSKVDLVMIHIVLGFI